MGEILSKVLSAPHPWSVQADPQGRLTVAPTTDLVVQYSTGGSDTVPAHVAAAECPLDPTFVWCPYVIPGAGTLHACKEADIPTLGGDFSVLAHVHQHEVVPHQRGGAAAGASALEFVLGGEGCPIPTGDAGSLVVPYACTIQSATLLADVSTTTVLDLRRADYAGYPSSTSLVASAAPTITAALKSQDTTLTGWTTSLSAGDILRWSVTTNNNATELTCVLLVQR